MSAQDRQRGLATLCLAAFGRFSNNSCHHVPSQPFAVSTFPAYWAVRLDPNSMGCAGRVQLTDVLWPQQGTPANMLPELRGHTGGAFPVVPALGRLSSRSVFSRGGCFSHGCCL